MKIYISSELSRQEKKSLCDRQNVSLENALRICSEIEKNILKKGDDALREYTEKFDGIALENFQVPEEKLKNAVISQELQESISLASKNITTFHASQMTREEKIEVMPEVTCWRESRAIENVGLYIPGGTAPLFSTILMLAIPAQIAGCKNIVLCTPPNKNGDIAPEILWTAHFLGITKIYAVGGAQAIFALAHGTQQIPKVDKIFGPGNQFVTAAKIMASQKVAIDMPAGPSEVLVMADKDSNPVYVAADLLSQCEHGADSQAVLLCDDSDFLLSVEKEIKKQLSTLPRKDVAQKSLQNSFSVLCDSLAEIVNFSNEYAPEHLIIHQKNWESVLPNIINAGSVFCGEYSPESVGDYSSGTNHTLPTSGFAKNYSGVNVESFLKKITFQHLTKKGLRFLGSATETMAAAEGLDAHKNAVSLRLKNDS